MRHKQMATITAASFNRPRSGNTFVNSNGHELHFRVQWENFANAKRVMFYVPGYSGHINRPEFFKFTDYMNEHNTVVIAADMQGHGHSGGERCLVLRHSHLLDDVIQLVDGFMNVNSSERFSFDSAEGSFQREHIPLLQNLPFFVMGSSMGGAISTMVAQTFHADKAKFPTFKGAILLAPALSFKTPHWLLVEALRYTVGMCAPTAMMPPSMSNVTDNTLTFKHPDCLAMTEADTWGNEGALGWNHGMRWGTALMFIDFAPVLRATMQATTHPFLIIHDPADAVCDIEGSRRLIQESATPSEQKELVEVPGYLHGLLTNECFAVSDIALRWIATAEAEAWDTTRL